MAITSGWAGQKVSTVLGFSVVMEPVLPVAQLIKFELYTENAEAWEHDYSFSPQYESESC